MESQGVRSVLYRLPQLLGAVRARRRIYVVEGEKDADGLEQIGLAATCNAGGAGKWSLEYSETLRGADVVILPDNDPPGRQHGAKVANMLCGIAASVKVVELPELPLKGDVSDWLDLGHTREELEALAEKAPIWAPEAPQDAACSDSEPALPQSISAADLDKQVFTPSRQIVRGLWFVGLIVLAARPKKGKSWLSLLISLAVAAGEFGPRPFRDGRG